MRYIAKRSRLIGLGLLLALSALTIYARFGARTVRQPKPVVAPTTNVIKGALPALRIAPAQSGGSFNITQSVVAGGGERSTGGTNEITGTIGQSLAAQSSGGTYAIQGGFWPGAVPSQCPIISIVPASVPNGDQGVVYPTQTFTASGGGAAYTFSRTGTLPPGLTFTNVGGNPGSAALTGTPTTPGTFNFTIIATDANQCTGAQNYTVTINCPTVTITTASLPAGTIGATYTATQLTASGGTAPHTFQIIAGTLPTGLTLTTGGLLSGTPTQAFNGNITVRASDVNQCPGERTFNLTVTCPAITVSPTNPALQPGAMSVPYTQTFTQTGGVGTIIWSNPGGGLPNGLTLNASTGELAGTPTAQGVFSFFIRATDANGCLGERQYSLTINAAPCPTITVSPTDPALTAGTAGSAYSQTFTQTGGAGAINWSVSAGTLPGGLTLNSSTGVLSGSPTTAGTSTFTIRATDINNCIGERQYSLTINPANNGLQFFPLPQPVRLLETRAGFGGCTTPGAIINAGGTFTLPARTACAGIPADAQAVTGNITVVPTGGGFLTLYPSSAQQPTVANSNFGPGEVTNNVFTVGLGATGPDAGAFKIFASGTTHVIVDVTGYYAPPAAGGLYFHPLATPVRLLETRAGLNGCIAPGTQLIGTGDPNADPNLDLAVQGRSPVAAPCNSIPSTAQVLVGNATSVVPNNGGFLTIYPSGGTRPLIASSNYAGNDVINGPFAVRLGADGKFKIYTLRTTHLVIDILGYYSQEAVDANGTGLLFNPLPVPVRLLETRPDFPNFPLPGCTRTNAPIQGNLNAATHTQQARNFCGLPTSAQAVVGNVSVVSTPGAGFLTLFPGNLTNAPLVATSNYPSPAAAGYNRHYFVGLSPIDGTFKILTQFTTDVILDASGYFAP